MPCICIDRPRVPSQIALLVALLLADVIQAIGMILNLRWITLGKVELGTFCTAQG